MNRALGLLASRDVSGDRRGSNYAAIRTSQRRDRQRDLNRRAIFPHSLRFVVSNLLAAANALKHSEDLVSLLRRDKDVDRFADSLLGGVAEEIFSSLVPARHYSGQR